MYTLIAIQGSNGKRFAKKIMEWDIALAEYNNVINKVSEYHGEEDTVTVILQDWASGNPFLREDVKVH